jgi:hypothetical protein
MSDLPDDKTLDEYLRRDSTVSKLYRNLDSDEVPPAVDSAILAQAREALVRTKASRTSKWTRWSAPIALAASAVMGIAVVLEIGVDDKLTRPAPQQQRAAEPAAMDDANAQAIEQVTEEPLAGLAAPASAPEQDAVNKPAASRRLLRPIESKPIAEKRETAQVAANAVEDREALTLREEAFASSQPAPAPAPAPAPGPTPTPTPTPAPASNAAKAAQEVTVSGYSRQASNDERQAGERLDQTRAASAEFSRARNQAAPVTAMRQASAVAPAVPPPSEAQPPRLEPIPWLEQIRSLRREGKVLEADEQWRQFAEAYPDVIVPAEDSARPVGR